MDYLLRLDEQRREKLMFGERCTREERKSRVMEGNKLQCGECGFLSDTVGKAEEHAEDCCHTNFILSEESFIDQHCCSCPTHCNSPMALELHRKRSGHTEYEDTEAKLRREEAEKAQLVQELLDKRIKEIEEELNIAEEKELRSQIRISTKKQQMRSCLVSIKQSLKFVEEQQRALNTLVTIVKNVAEKPAEEKYRRIRISTIEKRLGYVEAGFKFLELCKFEKAESGEFFVLPPYEVEEELLNVADEELDRALDGVKPFTAASAFVEEQQRALNTLVTIVKNVAEKPAEEKYRRIRISTIEKRLGYVEVGFKFLELCKFEKAESGEFFVLPPYEVEEELLNVADEELDRALDGVNPFTAASAVG